MSRVFWVPGWVTGSGLSQIKCDHVARERMMSPWNQEPVHSQPLNMLNPLTAGVAYIRVFIFYLYRIFNMLKIKCDINQQDLKRVDLHFVKSEGFSLTWRCGSRQRDTTSSGWKFKLNDLAVKGLRHLSNLASTLSCSLMPGVQYLPEYINAYPIPQNSNHNYILNSYV